MPVGWTQEGAASGRRLHGRVRCSRLSADTSVPKQREAGVGRVRILASRRRAARRARRDGVPRHRLAFRAGSTPRWPGCTARQAERFHRAADGRGAGPRWTPPGREAALRQVLAQGRPATETSEDRLRRTASITGSACTGRTARRSALVIVCRGAAARCAANGIVTDSAARAPDGGGAAAQRGAVPGARPGRRPDHLGGLAGRRDARGLRRVALDHRADRGGVPRRRLAGLDPPGGPRAGRARLAGMPAHRADLRRPVPDARQGRRLPALRRAGGADRAGREDRRVGRRLYRRDQPARGGGDARQADRPAVGGGAAHRAAAAGDGDARRGARRRAGGRGDHRGGPDRDRRAALGGGAARRRQARPARGQPDRARARRARRGRRAAHPGHAERDDARDRDPPPGAHRQIPRSCAGQFEQRPGGGRPGRRDRTPATSRPGSACRCSRRGCRSARCGSRSASRGRSSRRSGSSSRRWPASARSPSSGPRCTRRSTPRR